MIFLENKYGITIEEVRPKKPIPISVREYGQPFLSKMVSENIGRLQKNNFQWENESWEVLSERYPKCSSSIGWWTNHRDVKGYGYSMFNINYNRFLKEFILENPPWFKISRQCCYYAKKMVAYHYEKDNDIELSLTGIRKAERGVRAMKYSSCFDSREGKTDLYRPLFWYTNEDIKEYDDIFDLTHSDCYTKWGMTRTGCVGCPFNKNIKDDLELIEVHEPSRAKACKKIFADSYKYTEMYWQFVAERKEEERGKDKNGAALL